MSRKFSDEKRSRIIEAAIDVIEEKKLSKGLMDDIARRADVAKGTVYLYFKSKEDLFCQVFLGFVDRIREIIEGIESEKLDAKQSLRNLLQMVSDFLRQHRQVFLALSLETGNIKGNIHKRFHNEMEKRIVGLVEALTPIMARGVKEGSLKKYPPEMLSGLLLSLLPALAHSTLRPMKMPNDMKIYISEDILYKILMEGIGR